MKKTRRTKYKPKNKGNIYSACGKILAVAAVAVCIISFASNQANRAEMQEELEEIKNKTQEIEAENVELQRILEDDDMSAYMEKIAIENMNYAYPNERRYYDTSRN